VVRIRVGASKRAAGVIVASSGVIVTSLHLIAGESNLRVELFNDPTEYPVIAIAGVDKGRDLALVRIEAKRPLSAAHIAEVAAGQRVFDLVGGGSVSGVISQVRPLSQTLTILQINATNPERWGGPLFDDQGALVGITQAYINAAKGFIIIAVPADYVTAMEANPIDMAPSTFAAQTTGDAWDHK
jgi:S1-C subfamily serine protease